MAIDPRRPWTEIEVASGFDVPASVRDAVDRLGGTEVWYGEWFVIWLHRDSIYDLTELLLHVPGFLPIASDGSREHIGVDLRTNPPPVVMIDITAASWADGYFQTRDLASFLRRMQEDPDVRFDAPYQPIVD